MRRSLLIIVACCWASLINCQTYTSYFTGSTFDAVTSPAGGVCLMGGASEDDNAMIWFLEKANGGDVLVLRTSGSDGYNNYMYSSLGVTVNSVETIVCNSPTASNETYIQQKIQNAEAIWFAGGDQWNYVSYWRNTPVDSLINLGIKNRNIVIGGTSAGMAIQGKYYFSAENGTVTSATALNNPFDIDVTVDSTSFLQNEFLEDVVTDTHYDDPDRKGRHVVFLSRMLMDYGVAAKGIACDEYVAVCIDTNGIASVYGDHPTYDDNAYFLQTNCQLLDPSPEVYSSGTPLTWNKDSLAVKVYAVKGTTTGTNFLDLNDWQTGSGGVWMDWSVNNGVLHEQNGPAINCTTTSLIEERDLQLTLYPNPSSSILNIVNTKGEIDFPNISIYDVLGNQIDLEIAKRENTSLQLDVSDLSPGTYFIKHSIGHQRMYPFVKL